MRQGPARTAHMGDAKRTCASAAAPVVSSFPVPGASDLRSDVRAQDPIAPPASGYAGPGSIVGECRSVSLQAAPQGILVIVSAVDAIGR